MARDRIRHLRAKVYGGVEHFYWEPSPTLRAAQWDALNLGTDRAAAVRAALDRNAAVDLWRQGGGGPRHVAARVDPTTVGALIARYRADHLAKVAASTRKVAEVSLRRIDAWAGDQPMAYVTRARVRVLRDTNLPAPPAGLGHHATFAMLKMLRELYRFAIDQELWSGDNPASAFGLGAPDPRQNVADPDELAAMEAAAHALGLPSLALAIMLGEIIGQREGDVLKLTAANWREIHNLDARDAARLAPTTGPDAGKVMGIHIRQGKTRRWVGIPVAGERRERIEAAIATNRALAVPTAQLIVNDASGRPYEQRHFIRRFADVRAKAVDQATDAGNTDLAERLTRLQYRDLRRTAVVRLGELNMEDGIIASVTGHSLATVKKILETYMPRTTKQAARGIIARLDHEKSRMSDFEKVGSAGKAAS